MKIIVCLKLIADPDIVEYDIETEELRNIHLVLDPIGYYILEEALVLRQKYGGEVIALSVAPETGNAILRDALLSGADRAVRLWQNELQDIDTWLTAQIIWKGLEIIGFDLILCGAKSKDTGSGCMVSALARFLDISSVTSIIDFEIDGCKQIIAHKKLQKGVRETFNLELPAVLGLEENINEPRYVAPFSKTYRQGMKKQVEFLEISNNDLRGSRLVENLCFTQPRPRVKVGIDISALSIQEKLKMMRGELGRKRELFEGSPEDAAKKIFTLLKESMK